MAAELINKRTYIIISFLILTIFIIENLQKNMIEMKAMKFVIHVKPIHKNKFRLFQKQY